MRKGNSIIIVVVAILFIASVSGFVYLFVQNKNLEEKIITNNLVSPTPTPTNSGIIPPNMAPSSTPLSEPSTVVVYESESSFVASDKDQIQKRIVEPLIDYYKMEMNMPAVSVKVKINTSIEFPYLFEYILNNGVNGGGVITKTGGQIDWWFPECLNGCNLSSEFYSKYPDINNLVN